MDKIKIKDLEIYANHGVYSEENTLGQKFLVSVVLYTDTRKAGKSDELGDSVNYGEVSHMIYDYMKSHTVCLLEKVAEDLASQILLTYDLVKGVTLEIKKPWAPVGLPLDTVSVEISRSWHRAFLAFGSNMGDSRAYIQQGIEGLKANQDCRVKKVSRIIVTKPYGEVEQEDFLNGALEVETLLTPEELLDLLHELEAEANRKRLIHWGPRTLDLDILLYDDAIIDTENLHIPHIDMQNRDFVLKPMDEIAPYMRHPILHKTMHELLEQLPER